MTDMKNTAGKHSSENIIQELMDTARTMTVNANDLKETVETIITSCHTQGTKGEAHKGLLRIKADGMKRLEELYRSAARRYEIAAMKLADGIPEDNVLPELASYNVFISDQLRSEQECYEQVLSIIKT